MVLFRVMAGYCSVFLVSVLCLIGCTRQRAIEADTVFFNGYVYTVDHVQPVAQAVAVKDGVIVFVGSNDNAKQLIGKRTNSIDLQGRMMMPGLEDVHLHPLSLVAPEACDLHNAIMTLDEMVPVLRQCLSDYLIAPGQWMTVYQWNFANGNQASEQYPTLRAALDAVSAESPILLWGNDGHHSAVNSKALAQARTRDGQMVAMTRTSLAAQYQAFSAVIGVDRDGEPNGAINEEARTRLNPPAYRGALETLESLQKMAKILAQNGITTIQDAHTKPEYLPLYASLADAGGQSFRLATALLPDLDPYRDEHGEIRIKPLVDDLIAVREQYQKYPLIKVNAAKIYVDGVIEGDPRANPPSLPNAAVMSEYLQPRFEIDKQGELQVAGYVDPNGEACLEWQDGGAEGDFYQHWGFYPSQCVSSRGVLEHSESFVMAYTEALTRAGFNVHSHVIGNRAAHLALTAFAQARARVGNNGNTFSLAHAQWIDPSDLALLGDLGVYVAFTYAWHLPDYHYDLSVIPFVAKVDSELDMYNLRYDYVQNAYPVKSVLDAGGVPVAGSDAPVDTRDPRPFVNLELAITRANEEGLVFNARQRIDVHQAIAAYTLNGARSLGQAAEVGSIEVGKKADLIVINQNIVALAESGRAMDISATRVDLTVFDGKVVYRRAE